MDLFLQATLIVENVHLHILPSMNPDGFSHRRRGNANNIDLNRDFPDQVSFLYQLFPFIWTLSKSRLSLLMCTQYLKNGKYSKTYLCF